MPSRKVILRDFLIFQFKLFLDGIKDFVLWGASIIAVVIDLVSSPKGPSRFYRVLEVGERFELWLNLHRAASQVGQTDDGLFG
ncbi:MAG: hypothetical protein O7G85_06105, partial [Planctomycetota bacterium]|nr:hypothetical protein [Planctomycetota bacterium]